MLQFDHAGVTGGVWRGRVTGAACPPRLALTRHGEVVGETAPAEDGEGWLVEMPLPADLVSEGVQTLVLIADDAEPGEPARADALHLGRLALLAGRPLDDDLLAELAALRAELELVKRELRRHVVDARAQTGAAPAGDAPAGD